MRQSSHRAHSHRSSSRSRNKIALGMLTLSLGFGLSCVTQEPNLDYCATVNGDLFCRTRHPQVAPYCVLGSSACVETEAAPYAGNPDFDGCIATIPDPECHSPCGGSKSFYEESSCVQLMDTGMGSGGDATTTNTTGECMLTDDCGSNERCIEGECELLCEEWSVRAPGYGSCLDYLGGIIPDLCEGEGLTQESCIHRTPPIDAAVCSMLTCTNICDCPPPPSSGDAEVTCGRLFDSNQCYLKCDNTTNCPDDMQCLYGACMHSMSALPIFGNCGVIDAECVDGICYTEDSGYSICVAQCYEPSGISPEECTDLHNEATCEMFGVPDFLFECLIQCSSNDDCLSEMECTDMGNFGYRVCMWPPLPS